MDKIIVVCSKNKAKNDAVRNIVKDYFNNFEIVSLETKSNVSETPTSDDEGLLGCHNRIKNAIMKKENANIYIAMEGILTKTKYGYFLCGWTTVFDKDRDKYYYGCSAKVYVPNEIIDSLKKDERLSEVVANKFGKSDQEIGNLGTNGLLTKGVYTRTNEFEDSIKCALSYGFNKII